ncbi:MAG: type II toxin-antitoxin system VapC family toxin [Candidatus Dormibacteraceae bacterium]
MRFFVDANIVIYSAVTSSEYHEACVEIIQAIGAGRADGRLSTAVLEEIWHLESIGKVTGIEGVTRQAYAMFTPLISITDETFYRALKLDIKGLGTNDRIHVGACFTNNIDTICSADVGFDNVPGLQRIDPLDRKKRLTLTS